LEVLLYPVGSVVVPGFTVLSTPVIGSVVVFAVGAELLSSVFGVEVVAGSSVTVLERSARGSGMNRIVHGGHREVMEIHPDQRVVCAP